MLFIEYKKCSTSNKAKKWLKDQRIDVEYRDIKEDNPTYEELKTWYENSNLEIKRFFNTSGKLYREQNMKDKLKSLSEDELLRVLATNGMMVKRPILVDENKILIGFKLPEWEERFGK